NIPVARIQKVDITHAKGTHIIISKKTKTDKAFTLKQLTKNKELVSPVILSSIASSLQNLSFDDVLQKNNNKTFKKPVNIEFTTFNGLTINVYVAQADKKSYLWLNAKSTKPTTTSLKKEDVENKDKAPDPEAEAADINQRHSNWLYSIPTQKAELLTKQLKDLVKAKEKKAKAKSK
ncbi:MAG: hypothetical protein ACC657_01670, partial [Thiohalomonadales bacterium]